MQRQNQHDSAVKLESLHCQDTFGFQPNARLMHRGIILEWCLSIKVSVSRMQVSEETFRACAKRRFNAHCGPHLLVHGRNFCRQTGETVSRQVELWERSDVAEDQRKFRQSVIWQTQASQFTEPRVQKRKRRVKAGRKNRQSYTDIYLCYNKTMTF